MGSRRLAPCLLLGLTLVAACSGGDDPEPTSATTPAAGDTEPDATAPSTTAAPTTTSPTTEAPTTVADPPVTAAARGTILFLDGEPVGGDGGQAIWRMAEDGSAAEQLTDGTHEDVCPQWSPDRRQIVFTRPAADLASGSREIHVMAADGSGLRRLTDEPDREFFCALWSPDGSQLVADEADPGAPLALLAADGTGVRSLTEPEGGDYCPSWSPDGSEVVFGRLGADRLDEDLYVVAAGGGVAEPLLTGSAVDSCPLWSPDGDRVVFNRYGSGAGDVFSVGLDGRDEAAVLAQPDADEFWAAWSADGDRLLAASRDGAGLPRMVIVDLATGSVTDTGARGYPFDWAG